MIRVKCIKKVRDNKGNIVKYQLVGDDGSRIEATSKEIKAEMRAGRYDFINLQIDKAGRLVDKAVVKTPTPKTKPSTPMTKTTVPVEKKSDYFTVEDLISYKDVKDKKVKFTYNNKEYVGIGSSYRTNRESDQLHNTINVYCKDLGQLMVVSVNDFFDEKPEVYKEFWKEYSDSVPYESGDKEKTRLTLSFYRKHKDEIRLYATKGYKVDAAPNPDGLYTILKRGSIEGKPTDMCLLKYTRNDSQPRWERINVDLFNASSNDYTNVPIKRNTVILDGVEVVPFDKLQATSDKIIEKYKKAVDSIIKNGSFQCLGSSDDYLGSFSNEQQSALEAIRKTYDSIWGHGKFDQEVVDYALETTNKHNVYYAGLASETYFIASEDKQRVIDWYNDMKEMFRESAYPEDMIPSLMETNVDGAEPHVNEYDGLF